MAASPATSSSSTASPATSSWLADVAGPGLAGEAELVGRLDVAGSNSGRIGAGPVLVTLADREV